MSNKRATKTLMVLLASATMFTASGNSVGFDAAEYDGQSGSIAVTLNYDFTQFGIWAGGVDVIYDAEALEFVSYTRGLPAVDVQPPASPLGNLVEPGLYQGPGLGTFDFFNGITSAGEIGTLVFNVIGVGTASSTPCGQVLCLQVNAINPFVSIAGDDVSLELLANGITGASVLGSPVPAPAAVWFLLSGLGALFGLGRKSV